ncbi:hypothetical protein K9N68_19135 [Kovacikia minuta CCNUW1]|uniref:Calx-beta domain-containing protein n=1 Tax=Kovacikia minuta TaxID=2931930 RepID=UPI001CCA405E|nr:Calx-beta domain-containing protein [Kovacikia minuta]UBF23864.1 hypothetical protein K9N68_19135 [Kovacikia minuta CCNUW1]
MAVITVTNANDSGVGSLRAAIASAQSNDTIQFASTLANQTIRLTSGQISIPYGKNLTIDGSGAANLAISGNNASRIFYINASDGLLTTVTVKNLTLTNGYTSDMGGAIYTVYKGTLNVDNVTFTNNVAAQGGGAINNGYDTTLTVTNSRFTGNQGIAGNSERGAGAIAFLGPGSFTLRNSEFTSNRGINGGAINSLGGNLTVENSRFINNDLSAAALATGQPNPTLRGYGGAIYTDRANNTTTIRNSIFQGNTAKAAGGALYLFNDPEDVVTIESSTFQNNRAIGLPGGEGGSGGAINHIRNSLNSSGGLTIRNTSFAGNTANGQGGGLWLYNTNSAITNSTLSGNSAPNNFGGAITTYSPLTVTNTTIADNQAQFSGAISSSSNNQVTAKNTIFANNSSVNTGVSFNGNQQTNRPIIDGGGNLQFPNGPAIAPGVRIADPLLGSLQTINGALVRPLQTGSAAINAGVSGAPATDERGFTRDSQPDIGAFEFGGSTPNPTPTPSLRINDVSLNEGNSGTTNAVFTVSLSAASTQSVTVSYATANGTAVAGSDYTATNGQLSFNAGETSKTISVPILGNTVVEPNETFFVNLSSPANATLSDAQGLATIRNDDVAALPTLAVNNVSLTEGNSSTSNAVFTVSLSAASTQAVQVNYATANGSATAGSDYSARTGQLTFNPGERTKTISIPVIGDILREANETFSLNLSNPTNATILDEQGIGTISNDDLAPTLAINDVSLTEGNSGTTNAVFTVSLSAASGQAVRVNYATANGSATAGSDYSARTGQLSFNPGERTKTISIPVVGDTRNEANETFYLNLSSPVNATLRDGQGLGTIRNDDVAPTLAINDVSLTEGNSGTTNAVFTVSLSAASGQAVRVNYATANGSATASSDYSARTGQLSFNPGETRKTVSIPVIGDTRNEANETFYVNLSSPVNATIRDGQGLGTIRNEDLAPTTLSATRLSASSNGASGGWFTSSLNQTSLNASPLTKPQELPTATPASWQVAA